MRKSAIALMTALALTACNKDDVIGDDPITGPEMPEGYRPATSESSAYQTRVFDYTPAPGQFINETLTGGFTGDETTMADAIAYAERRLRDNLFVSLGSFGGYIVVGFDHSINNSHGRSYDIAILGNAHEGSNEPGIVWVMQDTNGNGLPDDQWYELRGSETGRPGTIQGYSVTYYRPAEPQQPVEWTDSEGNSGTVDYLKAYHKQPYYYPAWIAADSYTLTGTRLEARNSQDPTTGDWTNAPYEWGYVDNLGTDALPDNPMWVGLRIDNAIKADGTPANLEYIDFVKVQQGVMAQCGWIGENSCEVLGVADYKMAFGKWQCGVQ